MQELPRAILVVRRYLVRILLQQFLSIADEARASRTLQKLKRHDIPGWALAGGLALEVHRLNRGCKSYVRALNDIDFIVESFEAIPATLADDFLFRHIHPFDPPGKTLLQSIDRDCALRVDVFRAYGAEMQRTSEADLPFGTIRVISYEDLVARTARLALDLAKNDATPSVHVRDFLRLSELVDTAHIEAVWLDHRKPWHPATFAEASALLKELIPARRHLLIRRHYSNDAETVCPRCQSTAAFQLADPKVVLSLLGYC
jgi:hypothetical protein